MTETVSPLDHLNFEVSEYIPLIMICAVIAILFIAFKVFGVSLKWLWKLLINSIIGVGILCLFDIVFVSYLNMDFFHIPITWVNAIVAGVFGIPGVLLLLILKFLV